MVRYGAAGAILGGLAQAALATRTTLHQHIIPHENETASGGWFDFATSGGWFDFGWGNQKSKNCPIECTMISEEEYDSMEDTAEDTGSASSLTVNCNYETCTGCDGRTRRDGAKAPNCVRFQEPDLGKGSSRFDSYHSSGRIAQNGRIRPDSRISRAQSVDADYLRLLREIDSEDTSRGELCPPRVTWLFSQKGCQSYTSKALVSQSCCRQEIQDAMYKLRAEDMCRQVPVPQCKTVFQQASAVLASQRNTSNASVLDFAQIQQTVKDIIQPEHMPYLLRNRKYVDGDFPPGYMCKRMFYCEKRQSDGRLVRIGPQESCRAKNGQRLGRAVNTCASLSVIDVYFGRAVTALPRKG